MNYKIPHYVKFVDDFPKTVTGKIQKYRMREISTAELGSGAAGEAGGVNCLVAADVRRLIIYDLRFTIYA